MLFTSKISNDQSELLIESTITPEELANEPVQRFQAFQKLQQTSSQAERLGIFLNIAKACEQSHRAADALGALHRAARMLGEQHGMLADLIVQFNAIIPLGGQWTTYLGRGDQSLSRWLLTQRNRLDGRPLGHPRAKQTRLATHHLHRATFWRRHFIAG